MTTRVTAAMAAFTLIAAAIVALSAPAYAATPIWVTSFADTPVDCDNPSSVPPITLRSALCLANIEGGQHNVVVPAGTYDLAEANGPLVVGTTSGSETVISSVDGVATVRSGGTHRVMTLDPEMVGGVTVRLIGLEITGGVDNTYGGGGVIGGSYNAASGDTLIVVDSTFRDNRANTDAGNATNRPGGAIQFIGGTLLVMNSTFVQNSSGTSAGGAIAYQAVGTSDQRLDILGTTFSENSTRTTGVLPNGGAAVVVDDTAGSADLSITRSTFTNNTAIGTASADARGAGVWHRGGTLRIEESTFTGNALAGGSTEAGAAIHVEGDAMLRAHYNRLVDNPGGHALSGPSSVIAPTNWWGCAAGPGATGCGTVAGADYAPWLTMTVTGSPVDIPVAATATTVTASLLVDSDGGGVAASTLSAFTGVPIVWSDPLPSDAAVSPDSATIAGGTATAVFTKNAARGAASVTAHLDNAAVVAQLGILYPPAFTSSSELTFTVGEAGSFTVETDAYHPAAVTVHPKEPWDLPEGLTFTPHADGTATMSGTPEARTGGIHVGTFSATNTAPPTAVQNYKITILEQPTFIDVDPVSLTLGEAASIHVVVVAHPEPSITATGLPAGLGLSNYGNGVAEIVGTVTAPGSGGVYDAEVTASNGVGDPAVEVVRITVAEAPTVTIDPVSTSVNSMGTATFTAAAAIGYPTPTVQWQVSTDDGSTFTDLPGKTANTLTLIAPQSFDGNQYQAIYTSTSGFMRTAAATLTVGTPPVFTSDDSATFTAEAGAQTFTVETSAVPHATISASTGIPAWLTVGTSSNGTATLQGSPPRGSGGAYSFTLTAGNSFDPDATQNFTLFVHEAPRLAATASAALSTGSSTTVTIAASPVGYPQPAVVSLSAALPSGLSFTNNSDGTATITGTPAAGTGGEYTRTVRVENSVGWSEQVLTITVSEVPVVTAQPVQRRVIAGTTATFTAAATGHPSPSAQWQVSSDGGTTYTDLPGETANSLAVVTTQGLNGYRYRATFSSTSGSVTTDAALLTVGTPAQLTSGDAASFVAAAGEQQFSVTSSGTPVGAFTLGSTAPAWLSLVDNANGTATLVGTPPSGSGGDHSFTIAVDNGFGAADVQAFTLSVTQSPSFSSASSTTFTAGTLGSFAVVTVPGTPSTTTVTVTGSLPDGVEFVPNTGGGILSGTAAPGTGGIYDLTFLASNGVAPDVTQTVRLTVAEAPTVLTQPSPVVSGAGSLVTFSAAAEGHPAPTVQWQTSTDGGGTFTDLAGETATSFSFTPAQSDSGSQFRAVFTNSVGDVTTDAVTLTVGTAPTFSSAATATFVVGDGPASATVTTSGIPDAVLSTDGTLPAWLSFTDNGDGTATLAGEPAGGDGGEYTFDLIAGNSYTPDARQTFLLRVTEAATLDANGLATFSTLTASSVTVNTLTSYPTASFTVAGALPAGVSFADNLDGSATISGTPTAASGGVYTVTVTADNGVGAAATQAFTLTVTQPAAVDTQPVDARASSGTTTSFTAAATGYPAPTVQWQVSTDSGAGYTDIPGATSTVLSFVAAQADDGNLYRALFTGTGTATTSPAVLTVGTPAQITSVDHVSFAGGEGVQSVTLTTSGIPVADIQLSGAPAWLSLVDHGDGSATLSGTPATADAGTHVVTISASNSFGAVAVQSFTVEVLASGTISSAADATFAAGSAESFTFTTSGGHPAVTSLSVSGTLPSGLAFVDSGAGEAVLSGTVAVGNAGVYPLTITASNGSTADVSQNFVLTVTGPPLVTSADQVQFTRGVQGSFLITAGHGHPGTPSLAASGTLPQGLSFTDNGDGTATLSGATTEAAGSTIDVIVTASNTVGAGPSQTLAVEVIAAEAVALPAFAPISDGLLHGVPSTIEPGQVLTVSGSGFAPYAPVTIGVYSSPQVLTVASADATGSMTALVTAPRFSGVHTFVAAGLNPAGDPRHLSAATVFSSALPATGGGDPVPATAAGLLLLLSGLMLVAVARVRVRARRRP